MTSRIPKGPTMGRLDDKVLLVIGGGSDGPPRGGERLPIGNGRAAALA